MKPKYIKTPEDLYDIFLKYAEETKSRVRRIPKATNKGVQYEEHTPPLTVEGFKTYCYKNACDVQAYFNNRDGAYSDYSPIITRIKEEIRNDQIEGALVGQYQQNIVARLNGLTEKTDVTTGGDKINEIKVTIVNNKDGV